MNASRLTDLAELALAGYGRFTAPGPPPVPDLETLGRDPSGFANLQAQRFATRFEVAVPTFEDAFSPSGSGQTSFDVTVFRTAPSLDQGKIFLSFRGTGQQELLTSPNDLTAVAEIITSYAAFSQIVEMVNWWRRVSTPRELFAPQFKLNAASFRPERIANVRGTGEVADLLATTPGAKVVVTGSSLGGHLAMAFAGLFPEVTESAVAFNSPGFGNTQGVRELFVAMGGSVPLPGNPLIVNVNSSEANNAGQQLNVVAGYPAGSYPGSRLIVPIEDQWLTDVPDAKPGSYNHDQRQVTDALTVFDLLQRLDPALTLQQFGDVMRRSMRRTPARDLSLYRLLERRLRQRNFVDVHWSFP